MLASACGQIPKNTHRSPEEWRALEPLAVELRVHVPEQAIPYTPMGESMTGALLLQNEPFLALILLPIALPIDGLRALAAQQRKREAASANAAMGNPWSSVLNEEAFQSAFRQGVLDGIPGIRILPSPEENLRSNTGLAADVFFRFRPSAAALLTATHVYTREQSDAGQAVPQRFETWLYFHSEPIPLPRAIHHNRLQLESETCRSGQCDFRFRSDSISDLPHRARQRIEWRPKERRQLRLILWLEQDGRRLREAFAASAASLRRMVRLATSTARPPQRQRMTFSRLFFPYFFDGSLRYERIEEDGARKVLRSKVEPTRGGTDHWAGRWFDIPTSRSQGFYTSALKDLMEVSESLAAPRP